MRVAFVSMLTTHHRETAGARRVERVATDMAARGHDVRLFCAGWWDGDAATREVDGVTYDAVTDTPARTSFLTRLPSMLWRWGPDVVHASPNPPAQVVAADLGSSLTRAPLVADWYGDEDLADDRTTRLAAARPDAAVAPSELVRTQVREWGATEDGSLVLPEGIAFDRITEVEPEHRADVVTAHPLDGSANVESVLLALAEFRDRGWQALVVGDGPRREEYEQQAADLRIDDRVVFAGDLPREERIAAYRGAHVFAQTATRECFATELLWAMACGCVGIVEYQAESSAHELVSGRERGFRVTSPEALADEIVAAGDLPSLTENDAFREYDREAVCERYVDLYERL
jgi:glycosyltransferase involved in cell wall biosynthesis